MHFRYSVFLVLIALATGTVLAAPPAPNPPIVGGYSVASSKAADVVMAAKYAIQEQGKRTHAFLKLVSVERAEKQVVAGMNYRLTLKVKIGTKIQRVQATVYQDLKSKYSLSDWTSLK